MIRNVLLLAGGVSRRFYPFSDKLLWKFFDKPFLLHQIELFSRHFERIIVVVSHNVKEKISRELPKNVILVEQRSDLKGQAGAILSAKKQLQKGDLLVLNAGDILDEIIDTSLEHIKKAKAWGYLAAFKVDSYFDGGYLKFDEKGRLVEIIEKPGAGNEPSNYVKTVFDYFSQASELITALESIKTSDFDRWYEMALSRLISKFEFGMISFDKPLLSLKYPWDVLNFMQFFLGKIQDQNIHPKAKISSTALIQGPVVIEEDVVIGDFVKLKGPAYLSKGSIVADYAFVRESFLDEKVVVGGGSEVARSYLRKGVMLHQNYVGDSVLDENVMMGAGAITANFRFDAKNIAVMHRGKKILLNRNKLGALAGKNVKIGVNSTLYPGMIVGKNTWIAPGSVLKNSLEENLFFKDGKVVVNKFV